MKENEKPPETAIVVPSGYQCFIDKENGIFKNRERGLFKYDLATDSYSSVSADFEEPKGLRKTKYQKRPVIIVSFGDIYLLDSFMNKSGIMSAVNAINYKNQDTLHALVAYYILTTYSNCHAEDWWELTLKQRGHLRE